MPEVFRGEIVENLEIIQGRGDEGAAVIAGRGVKGAIAGFSINPAVQTDHWAAAPPDAGAAGRQDKVTDNRPAGVVNVHGIDSGLRAAAPLRDRGIEG